MAKIPPSGIPRQVPRGGYEFYRRVLDEIDASELLERLAQYRWTGRQGYSPESMWRAMLLRYLLNIRYTRDLIVQLRASEELRDLCRFEAEVPSESTFSRFFRRLTEHQDLVDKIFGQVVDLTGLELDGFGRSVALDSTDIDAHGKYRKEKRCPDPDAKWGVRTSKSPRSTKEPFYGYKVHLACDAKYGVPLAYMVLPANENDSPQLPNLFNKIAAEHPDLKVRYAIADRGYDGADNYSYLHRNKIGAVIGIRDTRQGDDEYSLDGRPKCIGNERMEYLGTDRKKGHLFRCPESGCHLKDKVHFTTYCDTKVRQKVESEEDLRKIGYFARANPRWQEYYDTRTEIERLFGSAKQTRLLNTHMYLGVRKVKLHIALSLLGYTGTMLVHVLNGDEENMRQMSPFEILTGDWGTLALAA